MNPPQAAHQERIPAFGWVVTTAHDPAPPDTPEHEMVVAMRELHFFEVATLPIGGPNGAPITMVTRELILPFGRDPAGRPVWEKLAHALMTGEEPAPDIDTAKSLHGLLGLGPDGKRLRG